MKEISVSFATRAGRQVQIPVPAAEVSAYTTGKRSSLQIGASLEMIEGVITRRVRQCLVGFLGLIELTLASMAAAYYGSSVVCVGS